MADKVYGNIVGFGESSNYVAYDLEQNLTDEQKRIARENINAKSETETFIETDTPNFVYDPITKTWDKDPLKSYILTKDYLGDENGSLELNGTLGTHNCSCGVGDIIRGELSGKGRDDIFMIKQTVYHQINHFEHFRYFYSGSGTYDSNNGWGPWYCTANFPKPARMNGTEPIAMNFVVGIAPNQNEEGMGGLGLAYQPPKDFYDAVIAPTVNESIDTKLDTVTKYIDDNFIAKDSTTEQSITSDLSFLGNIRADGNITLSGLTVTGDLTVQGQTFTQDNETIRIADNIIELNSNKLDNSTTLSGIAINKDTVDTYGIMYNPTTNTVDLGEGKTIGGVFEFNENEGSPLAVRDNSNNITDGAIMVFDKKKNRLIDSGFTIQSMQEWVRHYVDAYMSTMIETETNETGETLIVNTDEMNIRVIENDEGGQTLIIE